jgi:NAD+ synthase (glutamine-hydrolysing)
VLGLSGGLDSALALLVTVEAFDRLGLDRKGLVAVTMPGPGTTERTKSNAVKLAGLLGVTLREIPIDEAVALHLRDIGRPEGLHDVTFENVQARERTQILMNVAGAMGGFVVGTGDLSEAALGWCTFNGDHISMYHVNIGVPKTLVRHLVTWAAHARYVGEARSVLEDVVATPVSPELLPPSADGTIAQETEAIVGPYELHDFFLHHTVRNGFRPRKTLWLAEHAFAGKYDEPTLRKWFKVFLRRFFTQQFKRNVMPEGPKVGSVALSPRGDWRMPADAFADAWLRELE